MSTKKLNASPSPEQTKVPVLDSRSAQLGAQFGAQLGAQLWAQLWAHIWGLADDLRIELHKQSGAFIAVTDGALRGVTGLATKLSDRCDEVAQESILTANHGGRSLVTLGRDAGTKILRAYREGGAHLLTATRDNARSVVDRASASARVMIAPARSEQSA